MSVETTIEIDMHVEPDLTEMKKKRSKVALKYFTGNFTGYKIPRKQHPELSVPGLLPDADAP